MRIVLVVAVTTPLWASYLVKAYAWRMLLSPEGGPLSWVTGGHTGLRADRDGDHADYLWLPYMVIPVFAASNGCLTRCWMPAPTSALRT